MTPTIRPLATAALLAVAAFAAGACRRAAEPSTAYAECAKIWEATLSEKGADAYADPRAAQAQKLCENVPEASIDSGAAKALAKRIAEGRAELAEQEKRLAAAAVVERAPEDVTIEVAPPPAPPAPEAIDGGTPATGAPEVGSSAAEFKKRYGTCVKFVSKFQEKGGKREGEAWALDDAKPSCAKDFPEIAGKTIGLLDEKVFNVVESAKVERWERKETVDAGTITIDAGAPPPGPPTIIEEDLGRVLPGQPVPPGGTVQ